MNTCCKIYIALTLTIFLIYYPFNTLIAQTENESQEDAISIDLSYTGDVAANFRGGLKTGSCYMGMANVRISADLEKMGLAKGLKFHLNAINTHSQTLLSSLTGDLQVSSNIEAGNHTFLQELRIGKQFGNFEIIAGLQDLNVEFANSEYGSLFLNSSFGVLPVISGNVCAPIFPLTTPGITIKWKLSNAITWINAIYDGCPAGFDENAYNLKWPFRRGDGQLYVSELQYGLLHKNEPALYKVGVYTLNNSLEQIFGLEIPDTLRKKNFGAFLHLDRCVFSKGNKNLGVFVQLGFSPSESSQNKGYLGVGANYSGLFSKKGNDVAGLAFACVSLNSPGLCETSIEMTYRYAITDYFSIQPDLQYIINPSGSGEQLENCLAGNLRLIMNISSGS